MNASSAEEILKELFAVAVEAASPDFLKFKDFFPIPPSGRIVVVGAGKAAASMALSFERAAKSFWPNSEYQKISGLVITRYGHGLDCEKIEVIEASHPVPDEAGENAAHLIIQKVSGLTSDDLVVCLISGGDSALLAVPADGISLIEKKAVNKQLLSSGASISEINCVRKHLSKIKGGRLAQFCYPAKVITFVVSDVPGDDPSIIASGPTLPDETSCDDALEIINKYQIKAPAVVLERLKKGDLETPKKTNPIFNDVSKPIVMGTAQQSLQAVKSFAQERGLNTVILSDCMEGEASEVGKVLGAIALGFSQIDQGGFTKPLLLLSGGETTVTVRGNGRGGRNAEFLLSLTETLNGSKGIYALAADTDGIDGSEDNAGAITTPETIDLGIEKGMSIKDFMARNDAYSYFENIKSLIKTGPTRTNVNDFRAILILESEVCEKQK
ncbi:hydroxypyruvate reductase [Polynucleobacter sp. TUM22923]|uniref:glycerate kinase type-2 family protein n=1 Tax=Polynucleobacter sp. TUM22923 TaxID=3022126 RepID=UPI00257461A3|nr:glycerate kinase [Polynucleobacter sp. TUM22923]BDX21635.1 hydroxypyruvate reductase [Polynucleobacter sp. TUM22923]